MPQYSVSCVIMSCLNEFSVYNIGLARPRLPTPVPDISSNDHAQGHFGARSVSSLLCCPILTGSFIASNLGYRLLVRQKVPLYHYGATMVLLAALFTQYFDAFSPTRVLSLGDSCSSFSKCLLERQLNHLAVYIVILLKLSPTSHGLLGL